ncbi:MAG: hypothetical protein JW987_07925 [Anaerolineaceae bacterium]|nr:hypothetical protein [Anaerolineaceae bacterium]
MLRTKQILPWLLLAALLLSACNGPSSIQPTTTPSATETPAAPPTPTPLPTETPVPPRMLLSTGSSTGQTLLDGARPLVSSAAQSAGFLLEERDSIQATDLTSEVRAVVLLSAPADLPGLLSAAPGAQFVVVSDSDLPAAGNLTVLRVQPTHQAFIAGLVSVLLSTDWRAAGLIPAEAPLVQQAFQNGGRYFCGTCYPGWPLALYYPIVGPAAPADAAGWSASATDLFDNGKAEVFFLSPEASTNEVTTYLTGLTQFTEIVKIVGTGDPIPGMESQWAASVRFDVPTALETILPGVLAGQAAGTVNVPVKVTDVNASLLSPARQDLVNAALAELAAGNVLAESVAP